MIAKENDKDRLIYIKNHLAEGGLREDIAQKLGYRNWRSLDIYMRRKGMKWDSRRNMYYSMEDECCNPEKEFSKIQAIISMFDNENADPKNIAAHTGFKDHHDMAAYMKASNYIWSHDIGNYILNSPGNNRMIGEVTDCCDMAGGSDAREDFAGETDISRYLPVLDLLLKNMEKLKAVLSEAAPTIPRYAVPGGVRTKSFYMSDRVSKLINDYSRSKNISQKEIIEAAIIEFLCKYSYKDEVSKILDPNSAV